MRRLLTLFRRNCYLDFLGWTYKRSFLSLLELLKNIRCEHLGNFDLKMTPLVRADHIVNYRRAVQDLFWLLLVVRLDHARDDLPAEDLLRLQVSKLLFSLAGLSLSRLAAVWKIFDSQKVIKETFGWFRYFRLFVRCITLKDGEIIWKTSLDIILWSLQEIFHESIVKPLCLRPLETFLGISVCMIHLNTISLVTELLLVNYLYHLRVGKLITAFWTFLTWRQTL